MKAWSTSVIYTFMALYTIASIALCLLLLLNKKIPTLYRILGGFGWCWMYTSSQFISSIKWAKINLYTNLIVVEWKRRGT